MKYLTRFAQRIWKNDGVKYEKVTYYPRKRDHQDPPIKPTKLFMIERVKRYRGQPYWDKAILDQLKLHPESRENIAIVKNTPENCQMLMRIKHLIKITPIEIPEKLPEDLLTNKETYLHENGTLMVFPKADVNRYEASEKFEKNIKRFDKESMKKYLRLKWLNPFESTGSTSHNRIQTKS